MKKLILRINHEPDVIPPELILQEVEITVRKRPHWRLSLQRCYSDYGSFSSIVKVKKNIESTCKVELFLSLLALEKDQQAYRRFVISGHQIKRSCQESGVCSRRSIFTLPKSNHIWLTFSQLEICNSELENKHSNRRKNRYNFSATSIPRRTINIKLFTID